MKQDHEMHENKREDVNWCRLFWSTYALAWSLFIVLLAVALSGCTAAPSDCWKPSPDYPGCFYEDYPEYLPGGAS
ncbi:hypothetical protein [Emcibacter nanhaiensis]|uniref:Uncharacterized protein n=1 Tax=Emcibacter nanhaiensis TaxID=1505037 RepID=A0A501PR57_9PROT|nr:hypothetical protein [Emcibacter nanhaiensis]TPD63009.1 hypothetical protein FIV46_02715 [Emcibacter nanhaiensis]